MAAFHNTVIDKVDPGMNPKKDTIFVSLFGPDK